MILFTALVFVGFAPSASKPASSVVVCGIDLVAMFIPNLAAQSIQVVVTVPGTSDPWLAGMPDGSVASCGPIQQCGFAPAQSAGPVQVWRRRISNNCLLLAKEEKTELCN